jgi:5'-3' exonuclease
MILNSIRLYKQKFSGEYGELVIACDDKNYWRRKVYPYYKANRKKAREKSELDWTKIFEALNKIRAELREVFPYPTIQVDSVEADDVIATLCSLKGATVSSERILILSGDKDFNQLQKYGNVEQFDPVRKKWIKTDDPYKYVQEHIMRGDTGDGIPNFLSDDDTFVSDKRQKPLTQKKIDAWLGKDPSEFCDDMMLRNYKRNQQLVDFEFIPEDVKTRILDEYKAQSGKTRDRLFNYFIQNKLKNLMEVIGDF